MTDRIIFGEPSFGPDEIALATQTIESGWVGQGPLVERFEADLGAYVEASHVVAVSSCTAALQLSLVVAGVHPGDEVITTPMTFVATVNAIEHAGGIPRFVDVDPDTLLLDPSAVAAAITDRTAAIMPVSFGGRPLDLDAYCELADTSGVWIIEDAAHAIGAVAAGRPVGADRHDRLLTCFSFYPNKNLASAEGGAITLCDESLAQRLRTIRLHGMAADAWARYRTDEYQPSLASDVGFKANWTDLQAALAIPQLRKLEGALATREFLAGEYDRRLDDVPEVRVLDRGPAGLRWRHALHLYQVRVPADRRDAVVGRLRSEGIGAAVHYIAVNHHPRFSHVDASVPCSDELTRELLSLPLHPGLHAGDVARVVERLAAALET